MFTFLYVLVTGPQDRYADMTAISAVFVRNVHPGCKIVVLCDISSMRHMTIVGHSLLSLADEVISLEANVENVQSRHAYLKSRMRMIVVGDFVYLDGDTIVVKPLDWIFRSPDPMALVPDPDNKYGDKLPSRVMDYYRDCDWSFPHSVHNLNTGVLFCRDCLEARRFSDVYVKAVDEIHAKGLDIWEQLVFMKALEVWDGDYFILPECFNAQVSINPASGIDAYIWHFNISNEQVHHVTWLEEAMLYLSKNKLPDPAFISKVRSSRIQYWTIDSKQEESIVTLLKNKRFVTIGEILAITDRVPKPSVSNTFCTIITYDYLPYALNLLRSIRDHDRLVHFNIFVSDISRKDFKQKPPIEDCLFHFSEEVNYDGVGKRIKDKYSSTSQDTYRWSSKGVFINYLIQVKGYSKVIYADSDMFFFNYFNFIFDTLDTYRVLLTPHWRTPNPKNSSEEYRLIFSHGLYNAGFIAVNANATDVMEWWAENCLYSCRKGSFPGEYDDQAILNLLPVYFEGVHVLGHLGCNLAVWNQHVCRRTKQQDGSVLINEKYPVVFVHFVLGIPKEFDPMLGEYLDRYLESLRSFSEKAWLHEKTSRLRENWKPRSNNAIQ